MSKQQVAKYESGQTRVSPERLSLLVAAFDVQHSYFFTDNASAIDVDNSLRAQLRSRGEEQQRELMLLTQFRKLTSEVDREFALSFLRWMARSHHG